MGAEKCQRDRQIMSAALRLSKENFFAALAARNIGLG
jgi:hypothetical protein